MPTVGIKTHMILIKVPHSITNLPYNKIIRHYPKLASASHKPQPYKYTLQVKIKFRLIFFAFSDSPLWSLVPGYFFGLVFVRVCKQKP